MNLSVLQKRLRTVDYQENIGSVFDSKFWTKNAANLIQAIIESSDEHVNA